MLDVLEYGSAFSIAAFLSLTPFIPSLSKDLLPFSGTIVRQVCIVSPARH